jgi:DNA invertase Pin-like site-specific DNA recombinase
MTSVNGRLFGYTRVSTAEQVNGGSLEEQRRRIEGVALIRGARIERTFTDEGVSGSRPLAERPAGAELLATVQAGDVVVVSKLDRMFRNAADALARAEAFKAAGIELIIIDLGTDPVTANGVSKLFFGIMASVAEFERDRLRERQAEGQRGKLARGGHIGGSAPFGYRVEGSGRDARLVAIPEQQAAIHTMRELRAAGASLRAVAATVRERHGLEVSHLAVRRVLAA